MQHSRNGKTKQEDDTMIFKTKVAWQVQAKWTTHCFGSFLMQKHERSAMHISDIYATFQNCFKVVRALPQLHKRYETFYKSNSGCLDAFLDTEKIQSQVWCYQNSSWSIWGACTKVILKGLYSWCLNASVHHKNTKKTHWEKWNLHCRSPSAGF